MRYQEVDEVLRNGNAIIEETRRAVIDTGERLFHDLSPLWNGLTPALVDRITKSNGYESQPEDLIRQYIMRLAQSESYKVLHHIQDLMARLDQTIIQAGNLREQGNQKHQPSDHSPIRDMPIFDPGDITVTLTFTRYATLLGRQYMEKSVSDQIIKQIKGPLTSLAVYSRHLIKWSHEQIKDQEREYENNASQFRAYISRHLSGTRDNVDQVHNIEHWLAYLKEPEKEQMYEN